MGKINIILKAVGVSTAVVLSNASLAAGKTSQANQQLNNRKLFDSQFKSTNFFSAEARSLSEEVRERLLHQDNSANLHFFSRLRNARLANSQSVLTIWQSELKSNGNLTTVATSPYLTASTDTASHSELWQQSKPEKEARVTHIAESTSEILEADAKASKAPKEDLSYSNSYLLEQPSVDRLRQASGNSNDEKKEASESVVPSVSQATPEPAQSSPNLLEATEEPIPNPEILDPNANPLEFPTLPEEVDIEAAKPITLEQALGIAIRNNKDIQVSRLNLERSQEELRQARAGLYPTFNTQLQLQNARPAQGDISDAEIEQNPNTFTTFQTNENSTDFVGSVSVTYDIYAGGGRSADIRRALRQVRFNELDLEATVEQTRLDTATNYYALQDSDAQVAIQRAAVEDAQQTLRDAQLLEQAGLGTRFEVLQADVELAQAQQNLTLALSNQNIAQRQLAETLSVGQQVDLRTADAIEPAGEWDLSLAESIVLAYKNRAELEQFLLQREINEAQKQIALANIRPQVSVTGSYDVANGFDDDVDQLGDGYTFAALVQWTFYDGGEARAIADQEETDIALAETQFADQRNLVRFEVEQAFYGLEANRENIDTATRSVELAEESLRLARLRFQAGVGTQTDVIDAQTALTQARGDLVSAIIDFNQSYAQIQRAITNLPDNSLFDLP